MPPFRVVADFAPAGDQPKAIVELAASIERGNRFQTLLGITGSGKTRDDRLDDREGPASHPRHRAEQVARRPAGRRSSASSSPTTAVEYFVSYYDYYQPEAYIPSTDTYIEKDSSINEEIDRLRHSTTASAAHPPGRHRRRLGLLHLRAGIARGVRGTAPRHRIRATIHDQRALLRRLVDMHYDRNDLNLVRGTFRVRGDTLEIHPAYEETRCASSSSATRSRRSAASTR